MYYADVIRFLIFEHTHILHNAAMTKYTIMPIVDAPDEQYSELITVMRKKLSPLTMFIR